MTRKMTSTLALAAVLGLAGLQGAAAHEMQVVQTGENFDVRWTGGPRDTLAGGGAARLVGGGENATVVYEPSSLFGHQSFAWMSGGGEDMVIPQILPQAPATLMAQRGPAEVAEAPSTPRRR